VKNKVVPRLPTVKQEFMTINPRTRLIAHNRLVQHKDFVEHFVDDELRAQIQIEHFADYLAQILPID